jgi:Domain of unknown function (DUF2703)
MTAPPITAPSQVRIDFLFLDLETCTRCRGTDRNLESALASAREALVATGAEVEVSRIHVESAEQARELRFLSSPTIRVNGRDIALEFGESPCGSEACTDGCGEAIACRVWVHEGREYTEPPVALILDAILREVHGGAAGEGEVAGEGYYELPENLERFFAGRAAGTSAGRPQDTDVSATAAACCSPAERRTCCEPAEKADCCGATIGARCGCR